VIEVTIYHEGKTEEEAQFLDVVSNWDPSCGYKTVELFGRFYFAHEVSTVKENGKNRTVVKLCSAGKVK
jgi:hypothetical protein